MTLQPHQQRVVAEKVELDAKLAKLKTFIDTSSVHRTLPEEEKERLRRQYSYMAAYSQVLGERVAAFQV